MSCSAMDSLNPSIMFCLNQKQVVSLSKYLETKNEFQIEEATVFERDPDALFVLLVEQQVD